MIIYMSLLSYDDNQNQDQQVSDVDDVKFFFK